MRVFFATCREPVSVHTDARGWHFVNDARFQDPGALRFGSVETRAAVDPTEDHEVVDPITLLPRDAAPRDGLAPFLAALRADGADGLVYIHGFNYSFRDAVARTAQAIRFLDPNGLPGARGLVPFLYSWPSIGSVHGYPRDRAAVEESADSLADLLRGLLVAADELAATANGPQLHLLAHSMGVHALAEGLTKLGATPRRIFTEAILAAGDTSENAFGPGRPLRVLNSVARRTTVLVNPNDWAPFFGSGLTDHENRLGRRWPPRHGDAPATVWVNVTDAIDPQSKSEPINEGNHQYYRNDWAVRADLRATLAGRAEQQIANRAPIPEQLGPGYALVARLPADILPAEPATVLVA